MRRGGRPITDHTGERFSRLLVKKRVTGGKETQWRCLCDCGAEIVTRARYLTTGVVKSCGCLRIDLAKEGAPARTHGLTESPEFIAWANARTFCCNTGSTAANTRRWPGLKMQDDWVESFENFLRDMGRKPDPKSRLTRINRKLGYSKDNCRWSFPAERKVLNTVT